MVVEYSKCSAWFGRARGKIACAAIAASLNPCRISLSLPAYVATSPIANTPGRLVMHVEGSIRICAPS